MEKDSIHAKGELEVTLFDENMNVKQHFTTHNVVTSFGRNILASTFLGDGAFARPTMMKIGTGTTGASYTDNALGSVLATATLDANPDNASLFGVRSANSITYSATFNPGNGTGAVTEAGLFSATNNGTIFNRTVFNVVNKAAGDTLTITWTVTIN